MPDVVTAVNPAGFAVASTRYPSPAWDRVAITNADGLWHGFREAANPANVVRVALVTPSAAYRADMAARETAAASKRTAASALKARVAAVAAGTGSLTPREIAQALATMGFK